VRDVLEPPLAQILEAGLDLAFDVPVDVAGHVHAPALGNLLQAGGDVDTVAVDIAAVDDDVYDVDADPVGHPAIFRDRCVARGVRPLDVAREPDGVDDAAELHEHAVGQQLDHATAILCRLRVEQLAQLRLDAGVSTGLVDRHQAAVADDVGDEDGREVSLLVFRRHGSSRADDPRANAPFSAAAILC